MFYSNRTVINILIKFRLNFIQTKRVSYTQRHSHESLPPRPRSKYIKKKNLIFFYTLPLRERLLSSQFPSRIVFTMAEFRRSLYPISAFRFLTHIRKHKYTSLASSLFSFSFHIRIRVFLTSHRSLLLFSSSLALFLADIHSHTHAFLSPLINKIVRDNAGSIRFSHF